MADVVGFAVCPSSWRLRKDRASSPWLGARRAEWRILRQFRLDAECRRGVATMWVPAQAFEYVMQPQVLVPSVVVLSLVASTGWFEYGPRKGETLANDTFVVRVRNRSKGRTVELPDGTAGTIATGENLVKAKSFEELFALTKSLETALGSNNIKYDVFRVGANGVRFVRSFPEAINAPGAKWTSNSVVSDVDAVWSNFFYMFLEKTDFQWISYMERMKLVRFENKGETACRLCGGSGEVICPRCRGASAECGTCSGRRRLKCVWCEGDGAGPSRA